MIFQITEYGVLRSKPRIYSICRMKMTHHINIDKEKQLFYSCVSTVTTLLTSIITQGKTPFHGITIVPPPLGHRDLLPCTKEQEDQEQIEIKPCIKSSRHHVAVPSPNIKMASVKMVHDHISANDGRCVSCTHITIEEGQTGEENTDIPQINP